MSSSSSSYQDPPWAQAPQNEWSLVEIKDGVEMAVHKLDRTCCVVGRAADQVDIPLQHESVSRLHARIAFDTTGTPWLRDLASTHGVLVNKKRLPAAAIGRDESNSSKAGARGVVLYPGDILQFGASTRLFCLEGPFEFARGAIRKPKESRTASSIPTQSEYPHLAAAAGGSDDDDDNDDDELDHAHAHTLSDDSIPEQHRKEWERLKALRYKLENIKQESERIRVKSELSTGQERQLERNEERTTKLEERIRDNENELVRKVHPSNHQRATASHKNAIDDDDQDDDADFFDRTKDTCGSHLELDRDGETEQSLLAKWNNFEKQREQILDDLDAQQQKVLQLDQKVTRLQGDQESFFVQNDLDLANDSLRKLLAKNEVLESTLAETKQLLRIANPSLRLVDGTWSTSLNGKDGSDSTSAISGRVKSLMDREESQDKSEVALPARQSVENEETKKASSPCGASNASASGNLMMPPHSKKRQRAIGPSMMPPLRSVPTPMGTLAALSSLRSTSPPQTGCSNKQQKQQETVLATTSIAICADGKHDAWQAPSDQDGSGTTKLNAKFAGRY